jgi:hypothetical protein
LLVLAPSEQAPGLAPAVLSRHGDDAKNGDRQVMSYAERRMLPIDIAPVSAEVPTWRLDDTQTFVTVGPAGARSAALRAADLYRGLMDRRASLAAIDPGEGFVTWEGSPLWLSLAAIHKPPGLGVLPAASAPGRVQVMRTEDGEWLVEHAGGPWRAPRALRHHAMAGDDEALLLDVLYGVSGAAPETAALRRFEAARTALRPAASRGRPQGALRKPGRWSRAAAQLRRASPTETCPCRRTRHSPGRCRPHYRRRWMGLIRRARPIPSRSFRLPAIASLP